MPAKLNEFPRTWACDCGGSGDTEILSLITWSLNDSPVALWADTETSVTQGFPWICFYFEDNHGPTSCPPVSSEHGLLQRNFTQQPPLLESSTSQRCDATCIHQREQCIVGLWFYSSKAAGESLKFIQNGAKSWNVLIVINHLSTNAKLSVTDV